VSGRPETGGTGSRSYRGQSAEERRDDRRRRLLDAGLELFARQGYQQTSVRELCTEAKVSARHFYELFLEREELLAAVYDEVTAEMASRLATGFERAPLDLRVRIGSGLRAVIGWLAEDRRRARLAYQEVVGVSAPMEAKRRAVILRFAQVIIDQYQQLTAVGAAPARPHLRLQAIAFTGACNELVAEWIDSGPELEALVEALTDLWTGPEST
jgi:AcrR family transcriptional regulator